ncbi:hypothetical protein MMC14_005697 [Varicellaria rhodocarpa]|nr:hypothetical protein [Varicellaria rhodocarpa]
MALDSSTAPPLTKFSLLSFDIFGTLIDDQTGRFTALHPLVACLPSSHAARSKSYCVSAFDRVENSIHHADPQLRHDKVLARIYEQLASEWGVEAKPGDAEIFARTMGEWAPFPDTVAAMQALGKHYKLVALSNVNRASFASTLAGPLAGVRFDAVYTAEDIGSYKPDLANFDYLIGNVKKDFGVEKGKLLHVAQGLGADHVPAKKMGLWSAWISRGRPGEEKGYEGIGKEFEGKLEYQWRWSSLGDMAKDVERDFGGA